MDDCVIEFKNSLSKPLCDEIIEFYETEEDKYPGNTFSGINKNVKDTTDFTIPKNNLKWEKIEKALYKELSLKLKIYFSKLNKKYFENFNYLNYFKDTYAKLFLVQKYEKKVGKYIYHVDDYDSHNDHRIITYLWYLNTIEEGGETVIWNDIKIKPEKGKLLLFPSNWCFPHTGKIPLSDNKYIITGWIYVKNRH
jgi:hypothetical protein